jgi:hypothetical protein
MNVADIKDGSSSRVELPGLRAGSPARPILPHNVERAEIAAIL